MGTMLEVINTMMAYSSSQGYPNYMRNLSNRYRIFYFQWHMYTVVHQLR